MSIAKNYVYNVIYQVFILLLPLITMTYVSRILGSNGIGINAYTNSIIQYFILFGTIGISLYGNRSIAVVRDNMENLSRSFWSIFILKLMTTGVVYLLFLLFLLIINQYRIIFLIQSIYIISAAIDISWLFMGLEDFKKTVVRNLIVKVIGLVCIFVFVHTEADLWKYVLILSLSELIGQLTLWYYLPKIVNWIKIKWIDIKKHFMPAIYLFLPQVAIQIYAVLNKTMLGSLSSTNEVGYFDNADKMIKMVLAIVTAMGVVMLPRVSNTFAKGDSEKVKEYLNQSLEFVSYLSIPIMFGLAGISNELIPWFLGNEFNQSALIMSVLSPIVVFIAWSNVIGIQYLMPTGNMKPFTLSVVAGAVINFTLNLILIRQYQSTGTALATLIAELTVTIVQIVYIWKDIDINKICKSIGKYTFAGIMVYAIVRFIGVMMGARVITTFIQIVIGATLYFCALFLLRSQMNKKVFKMGLGLIRKRNNQL